MKKNLLILFIMLITTSVFAQTNQEKAMIEYQLAEENFVNGKIQEALDKLNKVSKLLNYKSNSKVDYLYVNIFDAYTKKLAENDYQNRYTFSTLLLSYAKRFLNYENPQLKDKKLEVYKLQEIYEKLELIYKEKKEKNELYLKKLTEEIAILDKTYETYDDEPFNKLMNGMSFTFDSWKNTILTNDIFKKIRYRDFFLNYIYGYENQVDLYEKKGVVDAFQKNHQKSYARSQYEVDYVFTPTYKYKKILFKPKVYTLYTSHSSFKEPLFPLEDFNKKTLQLHYSSFGFDSKGELQCITFKIKTELDSEKIIIFFNNFMKRYYDDFFEFMGTNDSSKKKVPYMNYYWSFKGKIAILTLGNYKEFTILKHDLDEVINLALQEDGFLQFNENKNVFKIDPRNLNLK